jgi:hypothetical protein
VTGRILFFASSEGKAQSKHEAMGSPHPSSGALEATERTARQRAPRAKRPGNPP